jgi:hypothetical protein
MRVPLQTQALISNTQAKEDKLISPSPKKGSNQNHRKPVTLVEKKGVEKKTKHNSIGTSRLTSAHENEVALRMQSTSQAAKFT